MKVNSLDIDIYFGDLFEECKNESEVEWLKELLISSCECIAEERLEELEGEE